MANLPETSGVTFPAVRQIENGEPQMGGAGGLWNEHAIAMIERTRWLKVAVEELRLKANVTVTVGPGGQFATINAALAYLSDRRPAYLAGGFQAVITLKNGYVMAEQLIVAGLDLSWIKIVSEAATVNITRSALVASYDARYPAFCSHTGGRLPRINALFIMDNTGTGTARDGVFLSGGSCVVAAGCGVRYAGGHGLHARSGSQAVAYGADFRNAGEDGVLATAASLVSAGACIMSSCGGAGLRSQAGSLIEAASCVATGCPSGGARAEGGADIIVTSGNCRIGATDASGDITAITGGRVTAHGATGGTSITINTLTASGIIFK